MKESENTAAGWQEPSTEKIEAWKKEYGSVFKLKAFDPSDKQVKHAFLRAPGINDLSRAAGSEKQKPGTYNQSLYENCVLDQHPDVKKSSALYQGMIFNMDKIIVAAEVEVEKL